MSHSQFVKIDSHAHLTSDALYPEIQEITQRAKAANLLAVININTDKTTLERGIQYQKTEPDFFFNTGATTPHDVEAEGAKYFPLFEQAAKNGDLVAVGETGLDYYYEHSKKALQQQFLTDYLHLAQETQLPVVIHCRGEEAFKDLFTLTKDHTTPLVLHCFTGSLRDAERGIERGWMISISGIATFKKSQELRDTITQIPTEHLLIETDAPYLAPQSRRGKQNEPAYIGETLETVAQAKGLSLEQCAKATTDNAIRFFSLKISC